MTGPLGGTGGVVGGWVGVLPPSDLDALFGVGEPPALHHISPRVRWLEREADRVDAALVAGRVRARVASGAVGPRFIKFFIELREPSVFADVVAALPGVRVGRWRAGRVGGAPAEVIVIIKRPRRWE